MIHKWKNGSRISIDPEKAYQEMDSLTEKSPENVLEKARDESTELHKYFEWRDDVAAEKYRLQQARHLIVCMVEIQEENPDDVRRTFEISSTPNVYQPRTYFTINKDEYAILLGRAKQELYALKNRYENLAELEDVFEAIESL
jgi:hypothetical protein